MSFERKAVPTPKDSATMPAALAAGSRPSREDVVLQEVRERLKGICAHLTDAEFEALVVKIALVQLKGEGN